MASTSIKAEYENLMAYKNSLPKTNWGRSCMRTEPCFTVDENPSVFYLTDAGEFQPEYYDAIVGVLSSVYGTYKNIGGERWWYLK